jgi:hypothetical protein
VGVNGKEWKTKGKEGGALRNDVKAGNLEE